MNQTKNYVDIGFWNAAHLTVHLENLTTAGREIMRSLRYKTLAEIDDTILVDVLKEAYLVKDKKFWK